jgi:hypothetical protein
MQQEIQERKAYAAKLEEQLRTDVVQQEIFRADLEDSVIEAVELTKQAETEKLEVRSAYVTPVTLMAGGALHPSLTRVQGSDRPVLFQKYGQTRGG